MILTIRQMEILVAAADAMNFSEAAERLGITQPSLSETVRRMEAELGLRLPSRHWTRFAGVISLPIPSLAWLAPHPCAA